MFIKEIGRYRTLKQINSRVTRARVSCVYLARVYSAIYATGTRFSFSER